MVVAVVEVIDWLIFTVVICYLNSSNYNKSVNK